MEIIVDYFDEIEGIQKKRPATDVEVYEIIARQSKSIDDSVFNSRIFEQLEAIDKKSIRALREGNMDRIASLENEAAELRMQLRK